MCEICMHFQITPCPIANWHCLPLTSKTKKSVWSQVQMSWIFVFVFWGNDASSRYIYESCRLTLTPSLGKPSTSSAKYRNWAERWLFSSQHILLIPRCSGMQEGKVSEADRDLEEHRERGSRGFVAFLVALTLCCPPGWPGYQLRGKEAGGSKDHQPQSWLSRSVWCRSCRQVLWKRLV